MGLDEYDLYDISWLGINTLKEDKELTNKHFLWAKEKEINFCYDLKKTEGCKEYDKKQILGVIENIGNYTSILLANSINKGKE